MGFFISIIIPKWSLLTYPMKDSSEIMSWPLYSQYNFRIEATCMACISQPFSHDNMLWIPERIPDEELPEVLVQWSAWYQCVLYTLFGISNVSFVKWHIQYPSSLRHPFQETWSFRPMGEKGLPSLYVQVRVVFNETVSSLPSSILTLNPFT
jgi:hypothetical protein